MSFFRKFLGFSILLASILSLYLQSKYFASTVKTRIQSEISSHLQMNLDFESFKISYLQLRISLVNPTLHIQEKHPLVAYSQKIFAFKEVGVSLRLLPLFYGKMRFDQFYLNGGDFTGELSIKKDSPKKDSSSKWQIPFDEIVRVATGQNLFQSIYIENLGFHLSLGNKSASIEKVEGLIHELNIVTSRSGAVYFDLSLDQFSIQSSGRNLPQVRLNSALVLTRKGMQIKKLELTSQASQVMLSGFFLDSFQGNIEGRVTEFGDFLKFAGIRAVPQIPFEVQLRVNHLNPFQLEEADMQGFFKGASGSFNQWSWASWRTDFLFKEETLKIKAAEVHLPQGGKIQLPLAEVFLDKKGVPHLRAAELNLIDCNIRDFFGPYLKHVNKLYEVVSGNIKVKEDSSGIFRADYRIDSKFFRFDQFLKLPRAQLQGSLILKPDEGIFFIDTTNVEMLHSRVGLKGAITKANGLNLDVAGLVDLADIGTLGPSSIRGKGEFIWQIRGIAPKIVFTFLPKVHDAQYLNLNLGSVSGEIQWNDENNLLQFHGLRSQGLGAEALANGEIDFRENKNEIRLDVAVSPGSHLQSIVHVFDWYIQKNIPWLPLMDGQLTGQYHLSGPLDFEQMTIEGPTLLNDFTIYNEIFKKVETIAGVDHGAFFLRQLVAQKGGGILQGGVEYHSKKGIDLQIESNHLSSGDFTFFRSKSVLYLAPLSLVTQLKGPLNHLSGFLELKAQQGQIRDLIIQPSFFKLLWNQGDFSGTAHLQGQQGVLQIDQKRDESPKVMIEAKNLDLRPFWVILNPKNILIPHFESQISASWLSQSGEGAFSLEKFTIKGTPFALETHGGSKRFLIHQGKMSFDQIFGPAAEIDASGVADLNHFVLTSLQATIPGTYLQFILPEVQSATGQVQFQTGELKSTKEGPVFSGVGKIVGGEVQLSFLDQPVESVQGSFSVLGRRISFDRLRARLGGGYLQSSGFVDLQSQIKINVDTTLARCRVRLGPFEYVNASGQVSLEGLHEPYEVYGGLTIHESLIQKKLSDFNSGGRKTKYIPNEIFKSSKSRLFQMNLNAQSDHFNRFRNDMLDIEYAYTLHLQGDPSSPFLDGEVKFLGGKFQIKESPFNVQSGKITFFDSESRDPIIDLDSRSELKGYRVQMFINGPLKQPKITFRSEPNLSQEDIVSLMTLGTTRGQFRNLTGNEREAYNRDEVYSLLVSQLGLGQEVQKRFGVTLGLDQANGTSVPQSVFRPSGTTTTNSTPKVYLQREILKNLSAKVGTTVGGENRQQDMNLEYQTGRNTSVVGIYEDQRGPTPRTSRNSMGVDFKVRWKFK